jgi:hypothetical protein
MGTDNQWAEFPSTAQFVDVPESEGGINQCGSLHVRRYQNTDI